jgi:endo-1,4-beta-xylanase
MAVGSRSLCGIPISKRLVWWTLALSWLLIFSAFQGVKSGMAASPSPASPQTLRAAAQRHHLLMGTAADADHLSEQLYASTLETEYSVLEPETEMKFGPIHPEPTTYEFSRTDKLVAFAQANGMKIRGHNLVWHDALPNWILSPAKPWTPAELNKILANHIATVMGRYKGKVYAWDVVNEPFNDNGSVRSYLWFDKPGIGFAGHGTRTIEQALRWAHEADPEAKLFVNEYGAETMNAKSNAVYAMAKDFVKRGVPLSGIGLQLHITPAFAQADALDELTKNLRRLAALGLEVQFTEVDVREHDGSSFSQSEQANAYKDLLDICLRQPACTLFQTWGFTDKYSWIPEENPGYGWALPLDKNYQKKRAYSAMLAKLKSRGNDGPRPPHSR